MAEEQVAPESPNSTVTRWERHIQSAIGAVIVALMLWVGQSIQSQSVAIAKLQVQVAQEQTQIGSLLTQEQSGISATAESVDVARLQGQIDGLTDRVNKAEQAIARLQGR